MNHEELVEACNEVYQLALERFEECHQQISGSLTVAQRADIRKSLRILETISYRSQTAIRWLMDGREGSYSTLRAEVFAKWATKHATGIIERTRWMVDDSVFKSIQPLFTEEQFLTISTD